jgi:hypothetical protein
MACDALTRAAARGKNQKAKVRMKHGIYLRVGDAAG